MLKRLLPLIVGFVAAWVAHVAIAVVGSLASPEFRLIIIGPAIEEFARLVGVSWLLARPDFSSNKIVALVFGIGFAMPEAPAHWLFQPIPSLWSVQAIGPIAPIMLHVMLSLICYGEAGAQRNTTALAMCFGLHATYNACVLYVFAKLSDSVALLAFVALIALAAVAVWWLLSPSKPDTLEQSP
jgi:hypothetical protein